MQKWAQVAEESGSRVWERPRAACHLTPFALARTSHWRHTAFGIPKQTRIPRAKSRGGKGTTTAQPVVTVC